MPASKYEEYAGRAWPILCQCGVDGTVTTYGELGRRVGLHHRQIGRVLSEIQDYCRSMNPGSRRVSRSPCSDRWLSRAAARGGAGRHHGGAV
jgi:alkylated DNA nucleotide flippase Atl1